MTLNNRKDFLLSLIAIPARPEVSKASISHLCPAKLLPQ